jgi:Icc-related predicted phosphoesterase
MRLQLISDLHSEFYVQPLDFVKTIDIMPALDFLVIAGDLVVPARQDINQVTGILHYFSTKATHVIYVEGNHEYYGNSRARLLFDLKSYMPRNYTWLHNEEVTLEGVHFYGGAMWFPNADGMDGLFRDELNDWSQIKDLGGWVYEDNREFTWNAGKFVRPETIIISHHLPHANSTPKEYKDSTCNRFFVSDQTPLITAKQPRLWLHGHTHGPSDYSLGATHVICNPYAYPAERKWMGRYKPTFLEV